jgi:hypothetical protein
MWKTTPRENVFTTGGSTVPSGEPSSQRQSKLQPSARVFEEMRERDHSSACEEDSPRKRGPQGKVGWWWMVVGGALGWRNFPVS